MQRELRTLKSAITVPDERFVLLRNVCLHFDFASQFEKSKSKATDDVGMEDYDPHNGYNLTEEVLVYSPGWNHQLSIFKFLLFRMLLPLRAAQYANRALPARDQNMTRTFVATPKLESTPMKWLHVIKLFFGLLKDCA